MVLSVHYNIKHVLLIYKVCNVSTSKNNVLKSQKILYQVQQVLAKHSQRLQNGLLLGATYECHLTTEFLHDSGTRTEARNGAGRLAMTMIWPSAPQQKDYQVHQGVEPRFCQKLPHQCQV